MLHEDRTDHELLERMHHGDAEAFNELFRIFGPRLCSYAQRITQSRDVAEELVQDVFLNIWTHRAERKIDESVSTYLFRSVRNRALNYLRHERIERRFVERSLVGYWSLESRESNSNESSFVQNEIHAAIQRAIAAMPERSREIFLLNREQGLTYANIAQLLDLSVKAVEYHMGRAFAYLRRQLVDWSPERVAYER
jgi:RNA polymerase sigma-70 factor (ECF subfamily)